MAALVALLQGKPGAETLPNLEGRSSPRLTMPSEIETLHRKSSVINCLCFLLGGKASSQLTLNLSAQTNDTQ